MDEQQIMEITATCMTDESPLSVNITIKDAWVLVSGLQLTIRHPGIGAPLKMMLEDCGRQFQRAITDRHPEAQTILEMGWYSEYDR